MVEPEFEQTSPASSKQNAIKTEAKARLRSFGEGILEFDGAVVRFFVEKGRFRKHRELVKELSVAEIESVEREINELKITSKGIANLFVVEKVASAELLHERISGLLKTGEEMGAGEEVKSGPQEEVAEEASVLPEMVVPVFVKANSKDLGKGVLEFSDNVVKFFVEKGAIKKQKESRKEIPVNEIESVRLEENKLSFVVQGVPVVFVIPKGESAQSFLEIVEPAIEEQHKVLADKEAARKEQQQQLAKALNGMPVIVDGLFDVISGLHGRIDWDNMKGRAKVSEDVFRNMVAEDVLKVDLDFGKLSSAIRGHKTEEISKEAYAILKSLSDYFDGLAKDNISVEPLHPNYQDAQVTIRAYYTLNDIILGEIVKDPDIPEEINQLNLILEELAKQTGLIVVDPIKEALNKVQAEHSSESTILECRLVFKRQLKQLLSS